MSKQLLTEVMPAWEPLESLNEAPQIDRPTPQQKRTVQPLPQPIRKEEPMTPANTAARVENLNELSLAGLRRTLAALQEEVVSLHTDFQRLRKKEPQQSVTQPSQDAASIATGAENARQRWMAGITSWGQYCMEVQNAGGENWDPPAPGDYTLEELLQRDAAGLVAR